MDRRPGSHGCRCADRVDGGTHLRSGDGVLCRGGGRPGGGHRGLRWARRPVEPGARGRVPAR